MDQILVTGATGQIGSELTPALRERYGRESVISSNVVTPEEPPEPFVELDVTDRGAVESVVEEHDVDAVFHLAAILSAKGERHPGLAWEVNVNGLRNVLEVAREQDLDRVVVPSSIAVYGESTPPEPAEETILTPNTLYGISKVLTELLARYYYDRYDLDVRGVRFPGILSYETRPGGGTTDYAVEAFYDAIERGRYEYFVRPDTMLPMMYMPDAIRALVELAGADDDDLRYRCSYNVGALTFTAEELTAAIREHLPEFEAAYEPDDRQAIADSWPDRVDDSAAREDWGWEPEYGLEAMTEDMLANLERKLSK
ncbi:MAG: NAD-dependent epimerase/dehydratase family protein [Halobacteriales archaeon]